MRLFSIVALLGLLATPAAAQQHAEDSAHVSGHFGIFTLCVRKDTATQLAGTDGDYSPCITDASGRMWITGAVTQSGTWNIGTLTSITNTVTVSDPTYTDATGTTVPANAAFVAGTDGTNTRALKTDAAGELQTDVLSLPGVTATATLGALNDAVTITTTGYSSCAIFMNAGLTATVEPEVTIDDTNWRRIGIWPVADGITAANATGAVVNPGNTTYMTACGGFLKFRLRVSAYTSGSASMSVGASVGAPRAWPAPAYAEDAAHTSSDVGTPALTRRADTAATSAGSDQDYAMLNTDGSGRLWTNVDVVTPGTAAANLGKAEDAAHTSADVGVQILVIRKDTGAAIAGTDGDYSPLQVDAAGALRVTGGGGGTEYTEDIATPADPVGGATMLRRRDSPAAEVSAAGDWVAANATNYGAQFVQVVSSTGSFVDTFGGGTQYAEDAALGATPTGTLGMARRDDALSTLTPIEDDAVSLRTNSRGALWMIHDGSITVTDGAGALNTIVDSGTVTANQGGAPWTQQIQDGDVAGEADVTGAVPTVGDQGLVVRDVRNNRTASGALGSLNAAVTIAAEGARGVTWEVDTGTLVGTVTPECTLDDTNWFGVNAVRIDGTIISSTTTFADRGALTSVAYSQCRLRVSAYTSGTSNARMEASPGGDVVRLGQAIPAGDNDIGNVDVEFAGTAAATNNGTANAQTQRVTIASDSTGQVTVAAGSATMGSIASITTSITPGTAAANLGKAEDAASADADVGVAAMAVRKATPANTSGTDGDYEPLQMSAGRVWTSTTIDAAIPAGTNNIGDVDVLTFPDNEPFNLGQVGGTSTVTGGTAGTLGVGGAVAHDTAGTSNPVVRGVEAIAYGADPTVATAGRVTKTYGNRDGIPFVHGGHPNAITREVQVNDADGAQTGQTIDTVAAGNKIVVTHVSACADEANTAGVNVRVAFSTSTTLPTASTTGVSGVLLRHPGLLPGACTPAVGDGIGIVGIGADDEDLRYTVEDPVGGAVTIIAKYFKIES